MTLIQNRNLFFAVRAKKTAKYSLLLRGAIAKATSNFPLAGFLEFSEFHLFGYCVYQDLRRTGGTSPR